MSSKMSFGEFSRKVSNFMHDCKVQKVDKLGPFTLEEWVELFLTDQTWFTFGKTHTLEDVILDLQGNSSDLSKESES